MGTSKPLITETDNALVVMGILWLVGSLSSFIPFGLFGAWLGIPVMTTNVILSYLLRLHTKSLTVCFLGTLTTTMASVALILGPDNILFFLNIGWPSTIINALAAVLVRRVGTIR